MSEEATERRSDGATKGASGLPSAVLKPERRMSLAWIVPLVVLLLAIWLGWSAWKQRGIHVIVHLPEGHGLKVGADVRYRGITVGEVSDVTLARNLEGVLVSVSLRDRADRLARAGSRFWVVRPQLRLSRIAGLETLVGPRYLAVLPANEDGPIRGARQHEFVGLAEPPVVECIEPGDLEIILQADRRGSLQRGAPVSFRQVRIGAVLSVGLASDSSAVEARLHIQKAYRELIRENTRFWDAGGVQTDVSLTGFSIEMDSIEELLAGGVALATPPAEEAGETIHTGHRFQLHSRPEEDWLEWETTVAVGSSLLPPGAPLPHPLRATIGWKQGFIIKGRRSRHGWALQTADGLLGPADLLTPGEDADPGTITLEVAGRAVALEAQPAWADRGLARIDARVTGSAWPKSRLRAATEPEDCIAVADPADAPLPLAATRLTAADDGRWTVDPAVPVDESWHGACVLSRTDGRMLGMLLIDDEDVSVALLPES